MSEMRIRQPASPAQVAVGCVHAARVNLVEMDKVRFGRALGYGARHAARTLQRAAEAATSPAAQSPAPGKPAAASASQTRPVQTRPAATPEVLRRAPQKLEYAKRASQSAGRSVWKPFAKFSSVLWLEITGSFFALFAFALLRGAWMLRGFPAGTIERSHLYLYAVPGALFAWFAVSNFLRARRRHRR